jgi:tetratricopeptide (TPR) repeat protein
VLVGGDAGIGKTTLVEAAVYEAAHDGALVLAGQCYDLVTTPPYGPWAELLRAYRPEPGLPPTPVVLRSEQTVSQALVFERVLEFLHAVAAVQPLVLVLEDLHWADQVSLDLLRYLVRQLATRRIVVLGTYRSDELHRRHPLYAAIPALLRDSDGRQLALGRLDDAAVLRMVRQRYALPDADAEQLAAHVQRRADGHALYVRELLLSVEEEGLLTQTSDGWVLGDLRRAGVPSLIRQVIEQRLARLGDDAYGVLAVAAVVGQQVPLGLWSEVANRDEEALLDVIDPAVEARVLAAAPDGLSVSFTHALIRETLYEGITPPRRRIWHRKIAEALLERLRPDPDALAWHFQQASDPRATDWLIQAGERAQRAGAWTIAAERFTAALPGLEADPGRDLERARLLYRIGRLLRYHDTQQSRRYLEDARQLARECGDGRLAAHARFSVGQAMAIPGNWRGGVEEMEAAAADWDVAAAVLPDAIGQNPDLGPLAMYLGLSGRYQDAIACAERFLSGGPVLTNRDDVAATPEADALLGLGIARAAQGWPEQAVQPFHDAQAHYDAAGNMLRSGASRSHELAMIALPYRTDDLAYRTRLFEDARDWFLRGRAADQGSGYPIFQLTELYWLVGNWDAPELEPVESGMVGVMLLPARVRRAWYRGDAESAWTAIRERFQDPSAPGRMVLGPPLGLYLNRFVVVMCLEAGDAESARMWLRGLDDMMEARGGIVYLAEHQLLHARLERLTGDHDAAREMAQSALVRATEPRQPYALLQVHRFLGQLTTAAGDFDTAAEHLTESLVLADACQFPFERALTLLELAELQQVRGDHPAAAGALAEVRAICEPLRALRVLDRVAALEARLNLNP